MKNSILESAKADGNFKTLAKAITAAGLGETLAGSGPFTVFAPSDAAFAKIPENELEGLLKDQPKLKKILLHHVIPGKVRAEDVLKMKDGSKVKTRGSTEITVGHKDKQVTVDEARVTKSDIDATNGVLHQIDSVMMPS